MAKPPSALERMREICLSLPDTKETPTWGSPHFRVGDKIFAGCGEEKGKGSIGFKLEMAHAAEIVSRPEHGDYVVRDLGSRNGVAILVRGERGVRGGERLRFGRKMLRVDLA